MMMLLWMCLMTLIITSQHVNSKVITINTNGGSDNTTCCVDGECNCSSLSTALTNTTNDTVINITSESVTLEEHIVMGSGDNITIIGNGVTIMCNYSGRVELTCNKVCTNIVIERITWDKCGGPNLPAAVMLDTVTNVSLRNCIFQYSQVQAVKINVVHGSVVVENCSFILNVRGLEIEKNNHSSDLVDANVLIYGSNFSSNGGRFVDGDSTALYVHGGRTPTVWSITIFKTVFSFNAVAVYLNLTGGNLTLTEVLAHNNNYPPVFYLNFDGHYHQTTILSIFSSHFRVNRNAAVLQINAENGITALIKNSTFIENQSDYYPIIDLYVTSLNDLDNCSLTLIDVQIAENVFTQEHNSKSMGIFSNQIQCNKTKLVMKQVSMISNVFPSYGGIVYINNLKHGSHQVNISESVFANNTSLRGSTIYIDQIRSSYLDINSDFSIRTSVFDRNSAQNNVIYIKVSGPAYHYQYTSAFYFEKSNFTNNYGSCIFLTQLCLVTFKGDVLFANNTADNGPALYLDVTSLITINDGANVQFINNSAVLHGGAVFIDYNLDCNDNYYCPFLFSTNATAEVSFINNIAGYGPNAVYFSIFKYCVYFSIFKYCNLIVNSSDASSIMHVPYQFNYSQIINGTLTHVPTDYNYTWLNVTEFPVVTSPHQLKLYGDDIQRISNNTYFVGNKYVGRPVEFEGVVLDYFDKPAEVTRFHLSCIDCFPNWSLLNTFLSVDNVSPLHVILVGEEVVNESVNVTLNLLSSISYVYNHIEVTLIVELIPCPDHPGYYYGDTSKGCICYYHDVVECYEDYNEIKRGYWFGVVNGIVSTTLCPNQYCKFANRRKTRDGYFELPDTIDDQCEHHRTGPACGECSPGYTLAYDSTDCISVDHCSTGLTVLVVVLTCLYWIAIVAITFLLVACVQFRISSGYVYGIIYYYSMVGILLSNNPYISDGALVFIHILSGFAQLTPRFLGQLCLAQGLSGIDQLFIHYCHAVAISLFLIAFVFVVKCSRKISVLRLVSRNIIPVISLLLLLSYTSLTSTSLQLLRPLTFTDISEVYTYSSPDIKYFHGRHVLYGMVAVFCELVIGIGLPVILIMELLLRRKVNLVRFKAFLDEFGNCYKDKYRWFAAYYLICRQLIVLIVLVGNSNTVMMFSLQILCLLIATIHMWVRPYKNKLINIFDGLILQLMVVVVTIGLSDSLQSAMTELSIILVVFPLLVFCGAVIIMKVLNRRNHQYSPIGEDDDNGNNPVNEPNQRRYDYYQESLFDVSAERNDQESTAGCLSC